MSAGAAIQRAALKRRDEVDEPTNDNIQKRDPYLS